MQQSIPDFERTICALVNQSYAFDVSSYEFLPIGDSAFSYIVESKSHERRYLKVFDTSTQKGKFGVKQLKQYVPLMLELAEANLFCNLPKPYISVTGDLQCSSDRYTCVLFEFVHGETLADAYPFSDDIQTRLGVQLGKLHAVPVTKLHSRFAKESYQTSFGESLHVNVKALESYEGSDPYTLRLQSIILPKMDLIDHFWKQFCQQQTVVSHSSYDVVLCHGDLWGGNIIEQANSRLVFVDWEGSVVAPIERDFFSYIGSEYEVFRLAYAQERQISPALNPDLVAFYAYRHQLRNLNQWLHNILNESYGSVQKENDLEMIQFHCLDRWTSIEESINQLYKK